MLDKLRKFLSGAVEPPASGHVDEELKLAVAVLLVEAARLDARYEVQERRIIASGLRRHFGLDELETATLLELAERAQSQATELSRYAKIIKDRCTPEQRLGLIELLFEIIYADHALHDFEANLMRRIGGLLYVSDQERGAAQKRVLKRLGLTSEEKTL
jgi:uncharacterized tellurite resistance protein B-like protein